MEPFYIDTPVSNNFFAFEKRKNKRLYVPSIIKGTKKDLAVGTEIAFEDYVDDQLISSTGLKKFVQIMAQIKEQKNIPIYIFDNHNHAFYFWHHQRNKGTIKNGVTLLHVDQHKDSRQPDEFLSAKDSKDDAKVFLYTNKTLNVGNFIPPAVKTGLINEVINVDSTDTLKMAKSKKIKGEYILDIDIDFFAPEMEYISFQEKTDFIKKYLTNAAVVTIATSPFFIEQTLAIKYVNKLLN
jgi:hypothetical protein